MPPRKGNKGAAAPDHQGSGEKPPQPPPAARKRGTGTRFSADHQPRGKAWTAPELALLGTMPDAALGKRLDRSRASIIAKRIELGIPAATGRGRPTK